MCLSPITIINPSKYVNLRYRDRYLLQVPCGHCAQCATNKANEWYYRSYIENVDALSNPNAFIIFDTLTYDNANLPHLSDLMPIPNKLVDFPCFNKKHLQLFNKKLRKKLSRFRVSYRYFITSEYGTSERHTHRPHYHVIFYVSGSIEPLRFSQYIADCWQYGRTDGLPYSGARHVLYNTFTNDNFADSLRTVRYVSKYVQKSCVFQCEIDKRINTVIMAIAERMIDGWLDSPHCQRVRTKLKRACNQFHLQSSGFGSSALRDMDMNSLIKDCVVEMPDSKKVKMFIPLPQYYKRKLFYNVVKIDGNDTWLPTEDGIIFLNARLAETCKNLTARYQSAVNQWNLTIDPKKLAEYVVYYRGRIRAVEMSSNTLEKIQTAQLFNYVTMSDREHLERLGLTSHYAGNNTIGYRVNKLLGRIKFKDFIDKYVIMDKSLESILTEIDRHTFEIDVGRQKAYELRQRLVNLYHHIGLNAPAQCASPMRQPNAPARFAMSCL